MKKYLIAISVLVLSLSVLTFRYVINGEQASLGEVAVIPFAYEISNETTEYIAETAMTVLAPSSGASYQQLISINSDLPFELVQDNLGNNYVSFNISAVKPLETRIIRFEAITRLGVAKKFDKTLLGNSKFVDTEIDELRKLLPLLTVGNSMVSQLTDWLSSNIQKVGYIREDRPAIQVLRSGRADCTGFMYSALAALKVNDIPARGIAGFRIDQESKEKLFFHNWIEYEKDDYFQPVDVYDPGSSQDPKGFLAMRVLGSDSSIFSSSQRYISNDPSLKIRIL